VLVLSFVMLGLGSSAAHACGGLIARDHAEVLRRASTLAAWHGGEEHYVTGFQFAGSAASFGYIIPLPGVPSKIEKGGDWTLERLEREVSPPVAVAEGFALFAPAPARGVEVIQQVKIDALDIAVLRGGGRDVADWARANGFDLTPDTPDVLATYRAGIFAAARFDRADAARRGVIEGTGTVIHFTIPTAGPWIPLRILALGKSGVEPVEADLFVLTDGPPTLSPAVSEMPGMRLRHQEPASDALLADLRSDRGMGWIPSEMWLTALSMETPASTVDYDLSVDGMIPAAAPHPAAVATPAWWLVGLALGAAVIGTLRMTRPRPTTA
jgi:hypothetical protein